MLIKENILGLRVSLDGAHGSLDEGKMPLLRIGLIEKRTSLSIINAKKDQNQNVYSFTNMLRVRGRVC